MNLEKSALLAEILGGVGIIVSILYLGFEVSENTRNTKISNHLALQEMNGDLHYVSLANPDLAGIVLRGSADIGALSGVDRSLFESYTDQAFNVWETAFLMSADDVLPEGTWELWNAGYCEYMRSPGFRQLWNEGHERFFTTRFRDNVESCYSE